MFGFFKKMEYEDYLEKERAKHKAAVVESKKHCLRCGFCCLQRPCIPTPQEFCKIAEFLKLSPEQTAKKYFIVDAFSEGGTKFLMPAKYSQLDITGRYIDSDRTFDKGYCCFYDKKKKVCKIHKVKPKSAKEFECWNKEKNLDKMTAVKEWEGFDFSKLGVIFTDEFDDDEDW